MNKKKLVWLRNLGRLCVEASKDEIELELMLVVGNGHTRNYPFTFEDDAQLCNQSWAESGGDIKCCDDQLIAWIAGHQITVPDWVEQGAFNYVGTFQGRNHGDFCLSGSPGDNRILCKRVVWQGELTREKLQREVDELVEREETK